MPKYWNATRLYQSGGSLSIPTAKTYFLLGTFGDYGNNSGNGASMSINGTVGTFGSIKANINLSLTSRGATATTMIVIGSMTSSATLSTILQYCDIYVYYQGGGGSVTTPQYYVYLVGNVTTPYFSFDLSVMGHDNLSYSLCLAEPAQGVTTTPVGTLLSGTPSILSALQQYNMNGNVGIGTTAPTTALHVAGTVTATGYAGLPVATSSAPGVVQVGTGLSVSGGVLSTSFQSNQIVQFVHVSAIPTSHINTSTQSLTTASLTVTITPKFANSKILVNFYSQMATGSSGPLVGYLYRSTDGGSTYTDITSARAYGLFYLDPSWMPINTYFTDTPNITTAVTYQVRFKNSSTSGVLIYLVHQNMEYGWNVTEIAQ